MQVWSIRLFENACACDKAAHSKVMIQNFVRLILTRELDINEICRHFHFWQSKLCAFEDPTTDKIARAKSLSAMTSPKAAYITAAAVLASASCFGGAPAEAKQAASDLETGCCDAENERRVRRQDCLWMVSSQSSGHSEPTHPDWRRSVENLPDWGRIESRSGCCAVSLTGHQTAYRQGYISYQRWSRVAWEAVRSWEGWGLQWDFRVKSFPFSMSMSNLSNCTGWDYMSLLHIGSAFGLLNIILMHEPNKDRDWSPQLVMAKCCTTWSVNLPFQTSKQHQGNSSSCIWMQKIIRYRWMPIIKDEELTWTTSWWYWQAEGRRCCVLCSQRLVSHTKEGHGLLVPRFCG